MDVTFCLKITNLRTAHGCCNRMLC